MLKIIIVEDDPAIAEMLVYHLADLGYATKHFSDGLKAKDYLSKESYDLVILDIMLPSCNGLDICRDLRQKNQTIPIMLLTSLDSETDRVVGLELGADDYLTKPFSMRECQARIKALLRRSKLNTKQNPELDTNESVTLQINTPPTKISYEELMINEASRVVKLDDKTVDLTAKEFELLFHLATNQQQVFTRSQLLDTIWGYNHEGYEHTVNTHINRIRKKLKRSDNKADFIQTVWAVGYKFLDQNGIKPKSCK